MDTRVSSGVDDAEESSTGTVSLSSSDIELVYDGSNQTVGLRFRALNVPQGARIQAAWLQFLVDETTSETTVVSIRAQAADNPAAFTTSTADISSRARTAAAVSWTIPAWTSTGQAGSAQRSPDLAAVLQEVVNRSGWNAGQVVAFVLTGAGRRVADAYEGSSSGAALLHVEFEPFIPVNQPPQVSAGPDQRVLVSQGASLQGTASDDGLPVSPGLLTLAWSKVSGPGTASIASPAALSTAVSFSAPGTYILRLSAADGELTSSDDVAVAVEQAPQVADVRVSAGSDDAEESVAGVVSTTSTDLEFVYDFGDQLVGMRFAALPIPRGAEVIEAWVQLQVDEVTSEATSLTWRGEASDQAATFAATSGNISSRPRTLASVTWSPPAWTAVGAAGPGQRTADLSAVVQEILSRPGWTSGNALALIVTGSGKRVAEAWNGSATGAPLLHVTYLPPSGGGTAAADEIHWTILGEETVAFNWRGPASESTLAYGTAPGLLTSTVQGDPPSPMPDSSAGPFWEAVLTGLREDTLYHYRIGTGPERTFRTPPVPGSSGFWIAHEAEIGGPPTIHPLAGITQQQIALDLSTITGDDRPRFVLAGGGLSFGDEAGPTAVDDHFNAVMAWSRSAAYMPAWGRHETVSGLDGRQNYEGRFEFPNSQDSPTVPPEGGPGEEWMWFDYGNTRFISYPEPLSGNWIDWRAKAITLMGQAQADPGIQFIVTWGSRSPFASGADTAGNSLLAYYLKELRGLHSKYVLNISSESRHYERSFPSQTGGLLHIVSAGGGAPLGDFQATQPLWSALRVNHLHHLRLRFLADRIEGYAICGPDGGGNTDTCVQDEVIDRWMLMRGGVSISNRPPASMIVSPMSSVTVTAGQSVNFQGEASEPDGNLPMRYSWTFGGAAAGSTLQDPGPIAFPTPGTYVVNFTAIDSLGLSDPTPDTRTITVVPAPAAGRTFYVSPQGSDSAAGSLTAPWRTVGFGAGRLAPGDTLLVRGGTYREAPSISVSGTAAQPITIASYPGETAVLDSGPADFRTAGNQDWELVDAALGEYRSVRTISGGTVYAYVAGIPGYRNGRMTLVPYKSSSPFRSTSDVYLDSSVPFYIGPGTWRNSDGRIHIRLSKTAEMRAVEARYGTVFASENADPRAYSIILSAASSTLTVRGSYLVFRGLTVHQAGQAISLASGAHDLTFDGVTAWMGNNTISVTGSGVYNVTILRSKLYGDVPQWVSWSDAKDAPAPADVLRGCSLNLGDGAHDVRIAWSHVRGGHDGIGVNDDEDRITVDHNRIENFADDCFELEGTTSVGRIEIFENYIGSCLVAIAPGQDTPAFEGPLLVYRNVIVLLSNPFVNRKAGINTWNGGGRFGYEYMFKHGTGSSYSTRNSHYYHNTLVMLNSGGKGLNLTPKYADDVRIANNLAIMVNGVVNGAYRVGSGMVWDGDLYWKVNTVDSASLLSGYDTVGSFSSATGYERNGLGGVSKRGTDPLFATWRPPVVNRSASVWELLPSGEVLKPSDFLLGVGSPAIGRGILIPDHRLLGRLPDTRSSRDVGAIPFGTPASAYDVFPFVPEAP
ncbi:MAG: PKD domain-containing protein [Candidatus Polarisedimenticolia bacterium]